LYWPLSDSPAAPSRWLRALARADRPASRRLACLVLVGGNVVACESSDARVATNFASGFTPEHHTVSVLGVYKDGQMSIDSWNTSSARLSPSLGAAACVAGYSDDLRAANADLSSAVEDYARSNGPTDDMLTQLAPAAKGDLVVVFTLAGKLPGPKSKDPGSGNSAPTGAVGGGGHAHAGLHRSSPVAAAAAAENTLEIGATIFSVAQGRSVGQISMQYSGTSIDDAMTKFSARLAQELPQAQCSGWDWTAKIDAQRLRQIIDE
jgi:hypothetical protein